jgi:phenylacetate-CoA ligase
MKRHTRTLQGLLSGIKGISWPPIFNARSAPLVALMHQLEEIQWLPVEVISKHQHKQLVTLAEHANNYSANFQSRMSAAKLKPTDLSTPEGLRKLPVLSRRELQTSKEKLFCTMLPRAHAPIKVHHSTGSTGEPVTVRRTAISNLFYQATNLRENLWNQRDFSGTYAVIRANLPEGVTEMKNWGEPYSWLFKTGPVYLKPINTDIDQQVDWLKGINPHYLLTYPNNLTALLQEFEQRKLTLPRLRQIHTIGETLTDELREYTRRIFNVEITDTYSSEEVGTIALQCPETGLYHVMSESLIVEVLDEQGNPCRPGQIGRVVATDLHNFATPLIRYDLNDYAEVGEACPCGRGLKVLKRIVGRSRNILLLPDGRRHWPFFGFFRVAEIAPIRQHQLIQRSREMIEVRLVAGSPLTSEQEARLIDLIQDSLGYPFELKLVYFDEKIPRGKGGKFEEFVCEVQ